MHARESCLYMVYPLVSSLMFPVVFVFWEMNLILILLLFNGADSSDSDVLAESDGTSSEILPPFAIFYSTGKRMRIDYLARKLRRPKGSPTKKQEIADTIELPSLRVPREPSPISWGFAQSPTHGSFSHELLDNRIEAVVGLYSRKPIMDGNEIWQRIEGPRLLLLAEDILDSQASARDRNLAIKTIMILAPNMGLNVPPEVQFFCSKYEKSIGKFLLSHHKTWDRVVRIRPSFLQQNDLYKAILTSAFAHNWPTACPSLFRTNPRLRNIAFLHGIFVHVASTGIDSRGTKFLVSRGTVFLDSVPALLGSEIRGELTAKFEGEDAVGRGVLREWFAQMSLDISENHLKQNTEAPFYMYLARGDDFSAIGRFFALSVLNDIPTNVYFPIHFWAYIMDASLELSDIETDEPLLYNSLNQILIDLPDGLEIEIHDESFILTLSNREELINRKINSLLDIDPMVEEFKIGFLDIVPKEVMAKYITPHDLQKIVSGEDNVSIDTLIYNLSFSGDYSIESDQIQWLLAFLSTKELRQKFLIFVTGSARLPMGGVLSRKIEIASCPEPDKLPSSHTCTYQLCLPLYPNEAMLRERMETALESDTGMFLM